MKRMIRLFLVLLLSISLTLTLTNTVLARGRGGYGGYKSFSSPRTSTPRIYSPRISTPRISSPKIFSPKKSTPKIPTFSAPKIPSPSYPKIGISSSNKPERSEAKKRQFLKQQGLDKVPPGFEVDHIVPLSKGGADESYNMQLIPKEMHKQKTKMERKH